MTVMVARFGVTTICSPGRMRLGFGPSSASFAAKIAWYPWVVNHAEIPDRVSPGVTVTTNVPGAGPAVAPDGTVDGGDVVTGVVVTGAVVTVGMVVGSGTTVVVVG
jgi:hypothetical protein